MSRLGIIFEALETEQTEKFKARYNSIVKFYIQSYISPWHSVLLSWHYDDNHGSTILDPLLHKTGPKAFWILHLYLLLVGFFDISHGRAEKWTVDKRFTS